MFEINKVMKCISYSILVLASLLVSMTMIHAEEKPVDWDWPKGCKPKCEAPSEELMSAAVELKSLVTSNSAGEITWDAKTKPLASEVVESSRMVVSKWKEAYPDLELITPFIRGVNCPPKCILPGQKVAATVGNLELIVSETKRHLVAIKQIKADPRLGAMVTPEELARDIIQLNATIESIVETIK